jgi:hypothetical protein
VKRVLEKFDKKRPLDPSIKFEGERNVAFTGVGGDVCVQIGNLGRIETHENIINTLTEFFGGSFLLTEVMKPVDYLLKFVVPLILKNLIKFVKL